MAAFGKRSVFSMSLIVMQPAQLAVLVHHEQLLDAVLVQQLLARAPAVVPGAHRHEPLARVITFEIGWSSSRTKRRSRLVRMPTALPSRVTGTPEMR